MRAELPHTWQWFALATLIAFLVNTSSFLVIKRTNVVMLKLLAIARNALVVFSGILFFQAPSRPKVPCRPPRPSPLTSLPPPLQDRVTPIQFLGYSITLVFFAVYNLMQFYPEAVERVLENWRR